MNWSYLFKHWFSTLLIAPIVADIILYYYGDNNYLFNLTPLLPATLFLGLLFSLPTYICYALIFSILEKIKVKTEYSKIILIAITIIGINISFNLIFGTEDKNLPLAYSLTSIFFGLVYKLRESSEIH